MPESSFYLNSTYCKCSIDPGEINSVGGPDNPKLQIFFGLELDPGSGKQYKAFILQSIEAKLRLFGSSFEISSGYSFQNVRVESKASVRHSIEFPVTEFKIQKIEDKRIDNIKCSLELIFRVINLSKLTNVIQDKELIFMTDLTYSACNIDFLIPQSDWVTKHLPGLGYKQMRLFELPAVNELITEEYSQSLKELEMATDYFNKGDYDKVVSHCRSAIDPIKKSLPQLKKYIESKSEFDWYKSINDSTFVWLDRVLKDTTNFASKTHHAPSTGHFAKEDSQSVLLITTGIVGFAGKCLKVSDK